MLQFCATQFPARSDHICLRAFVVGCVGHMKRNERKITSRLSPNHADDVKYRCARSLARSARSFIFATDDSEQIREVQTCKHLTKNAARETHRGDATLVIWKVRLTGSSEQSVIHLNASSFPSCTWDRRLSSLHLVCQRALTFTLLTARIWLGNCAHALYYKVQQRHLKWSNAPIIYFIRFESQFCHRVEETF